MACERSQCQREGKPRIPSGIEGWAGFLPSAYTSVLSHFSSINRRAVFTTFNRYKLRLHPCMANLDLQRLANDTLNSYMKKIQDDVITYREMCDAERSQTLQRGMNFRMNPSYSVILMSQRSNAPYQDRINDDGITIEYEGHDVSKRTPDHNPKNEDQPDKLPGGRLTQNGLFIKAVREFKETRSMPELVKVYEKVFPGVWSLKGFFDLIDYKIIHDGKRNVFRYILRLSDREEGRDRHSLTSDHTRLIPSEVKKEVWKRDHGKCVICSDDKNLHFDHDVPFSKGGTSLSAKNVRLLCMKHNLQKSAKIE
jgi:hypothetical protein